MKRLTVSCKSADQVFKDFKHAARRVQRGSRKEPELELSFDNQVDFDRFVRKTLNNRMGISVYVPPAIERELKRIAKANAQTVPQIAIEALKQYLARRRKPIVL